MLELRYYQKDCIDAFYEYTAHNFGKHPLMVLPTGTGKSICIAEITRRILDDSDNSKILNVTHQKHLIQQNHDEFMDLMISQGRLIDVGIYSAGLKKRDRHTRVLFAGIQSIHKKAWTDIGYYDVILIDEAHLIPHGSEGMYRTFLKEMQEINKNIVIAGLSATPYRLKHGILTEGDGHLFDDICFEAGISELINPNHHKNRDKKQYLCPLISPDSTMKSKVDLSKVHIRGGEYVEEEMQEAFNQKELVEKSVKEIIEYTPSRKKTIVFTAGIKHCEAVFKEFGKYTTKIDFIHSQRTEIENKTAIENFKSGKIKYLINVSVLTTGFNEKSIDCVCLLRSTMSPGLYVQMCGRGSRLFPDKENCLVLDFGGNILRHGPIDKIEIWRNPKTGKSEVGTAPQKECPKCTFLMHIVTKICPNCGFEFNDEEKPKHEEKASHEDILSKWKKPVQYDITRVVYKKHEKQGSPTSLRVDYYIDMYKFFSEWICLEHSGFAKNKALKWLHQRTDLNIETVQEALDKQNSIKVPYQITVDINDKFPRIVSYSFEKTLTEEIIPF